MNDDLLKLLWKGVADIEQQQEAADHIEALQAQLDEAVTALERAERVMDDPDCEPGNSITNTIIAVRAILAKLKGINHD